MWRLEQVRNAKKCMNFSNKILLNVAKCQGYNFYHFRVINGKPTEGRDGNLRPLHARTPSCELDNSTFKALHLFILY